MSITQHLVFLGCVACAAYAQTLTGFAFGLVLLGLGGLTGVAPLADMANVASLLLVLNAAIALRRSAPRAPARVLAPALVTVAGGSVAGLWLLGWLSARTALGLQTLLGLTILGCAFILLMPRPTRQGESSPGAFAFTGALAGIMGGLFASPGPPLVYHFYRQPWPFTEVRNSLLLLFGASAALRLLLLAPTGGVGAASLWLTLEAAPVALGVAWLLRRRAAAGTPASVRHVVFVLLLVAGAGLVLPAAGELGTALRSLGQAPATR